MPQGGLEAMGAHRLPQGDQGAMGGQTTQGLVGRQVDAGRQARGGQPV